MGENYISNISAIDTQGIINKDGQRHDHIQQLRGMSLNLNLDIPINLPLLENQALHQDEEYLQLLGDERSLYATKDLDSDSRRKYQTAMYKRKACYYRNHSKALKAFRLKSFKNASTDEIKKQIELGKQQEVGALLPEDDKPLINDRLEFVSEDIFNDRWFIACYFWGPPAGNVLHDTQILARLQSFCDPAPFVLYYPGQSPTHGLCPVCKIDINNINRFERPDHIHSCLKQELFLVNKTKFDRECPDHCKWAGCKNTQLGKKVRYLPEDFGSSIHDPLVRKHAREQESKRLHDQRRRAWKTTDVSSQMTSRKLLSAHFTRHVIGSTQCKWDGCSVPCTSEFGLQRHLFEAHQLDVRPTAFRPKFCYKHPQSGWFLNEFDWDDHCELHVRNVSLSCGLDKAYGAVISGLCCPFCLGMKEATASQRYRQFDRRDMLNSHMKSHMKKEPTVPVKCPVPGCVHEPMADFQGLQVHFADAHQIQPEGYKKTLGFIKRGIKKTDSCSLHGEESDISESMHSETESDWEDDEEDSNKEIGLIKKSKLKRSREQTGPLIGVKRGKPV